MTLLFVLASRRFCWSCPTQLRSTRQWVGSFCCGVAGACIDTALHLAGTRNGLMNSFGFWSFPTSHACSSWPRWWTVCITVCPWRQHGSHTPGQSCWRLRWLLAGSWHCLLVDRASAWNHISFLARETSIIISTDLSRKHEISTMCYYSMKLQLGLWIHLTSVVTSAMRWWSSSSVLDCLSLSTVGS